jgi:DNA-binding GntR family transcriptional regulator
LTSSTDMAYASIRGAILAGVFGPDQRLPEDELAAMAGVSRTPVREALRMLEAEGLVIFEPRRGARVTTHSNRELHDLYELRALLEGYGAGLAAERISNEDLEQISGLAQQMSAIVDQPESADEMTRLNGEFHRTIAVAAQNNHLANMVATVTNVPLIFLTFQQYSVDRMRASVRQHAELVQALRARDRQWAEAIMRTHILAARASLAESAAGSGDESHQEITPRSSRDSRSSSTA